jgi:hypothetical protein
MLWLRTKCAHTKLFRQNIHTHTKKYCNVPRHCIHDHHTSVFQLAPYAQSSIPPLTGYTVSPMVPMTYWPSNRPAGPAASRNFSAWPDSQ